MPATSNKAQLLPRVKQLHFDEGMTLRAISDLLGVHEITLAKWIRAEGLTPRRSGYKQHQVIRAARAGETKVKRNCRQCGAEFEDYEYRNRAFCNRDCTNTWQREHAADEKFRRWCPCGQEVLNNPYQNKHCSPECRKKYGKKRPADPANTIEAICQNPSCARPERKFTHPKAQGYRKYCSDKCSQEHVRPAEQMNGLEQLFMSLTRLMGIGCRRPEGAEQIPFGPRGSYAPDFILDWQGETLSVETKGDRWVKGDTAAKHALWRRERGRLAMVFKDDMQELRMMPDAQAYWSALKVKAISQED